MNAAGMMQKFQHMLQQFTSILQESSRTFNTTNNRNDSSQYDMQSAKYVCYVRFGRMNQDYGLLQLAEQ